MPSSNSGNDSGTAGGSGSAAVLQDIVEFQKLMPGQQQIVVQFLEVFEFELEQAVIPCRPLRRLVGHDAERLHLRVRQVVRKGNGHLGQAEHEGRFQTQMPRQ